MQTTGNLGLKKPEGTDLVDIADLNGNMDILDNAVTGKVDKVTGKQLSTNDYSAAEKTKLAGIASGANNYTHPNHTGDVTSTGDGVTAIAAGVIVNADVNAAAGIDASKIGTGVVSNAEFGYLDGVTSGIQGQLNNKLPAGGGTMIGDISMDPLYTNANSPSRLIRFSFRNTLNVLKEKLFGVNAAGQLNLTVPGEGEYIVPLATSADITYYVRTDGSDSNNGLANTSAGAFKTINKAVSMIPKFGEHSRSIRVAAGTYNEEVVLKGFGGSGSVEIVNSGTIASGIVNVNKLVISGCSSQVTITGITATTITSMGFEIVACTWVWLANCFTLSGATNQYGISVYGSTAIVSNGIYSNKYAAIWARNASNVFATNVQGANNSFGFLATEGAKIGLSANTLIATTLSSAQTGGIVTNSEVGVINPWGDNTLSTRSNFKAWHTIAQTITSKTMVKLVYSTKVFDPLSEYNASISRFTASQDGVYLVSAASSITGAPAGTVLVLTAWVNGARNTDIGSSPVGSNTLYAQGSTPIKLTAGMYVEIYTFLDTSAGSLNTLGSNGELNHFAVTRIA